MISILIPVYNYVLIDLVQELHEQSLACKIPFEILVLDDYSLESYKQENKKIQLFEHVQYHELPKNIGRSKIRNALAQLAQYPYLLFMDCDAKIPNPDFIQKYINECVGDVVICGGTTYEKEKPQTHDTLRWYYGNQREVRLACERNLNPNTSFTTFNFLISKSIFSQITFNETITIYGHEDTLFGYELKKRNFIIKHIDNPLIHLGLDSNRDFVLKTKQSIKSLHSILQNNEIDQQFADDVRILGMYKKLKSMKMAKACAFIYNLTHRTIEYRLINKSPKLFLFDLYKIGYLSSLKK